MARSEITEVGKYRILGQIGEGAMGVVYRALDPVLNRPVAIKVMSDAVARDDELRGRFLREAQAAGSLQHPNVVTIYDFGEVEGHLFIAMEFVEGADLEDVLRKRLPLSPMEKIDILIDVLTGLSYAHKRGIVHRDIKPANIRIDPEGRARIMDFGIAHLTSSNMTRTGVMVGTPAYMAPEQIVGGEITPASDIFAVGAVMYELFAGVKPFQGETLQSVMYKIVSQAPPSITKYAGDLPASLGAVVDRALAKEPTARFSSAVEMASALSSARADLAQSPRTSTPLSLRSSIATALADERAAKARGTMYRRLGIGGALALAAAATVIVLSFRGSGAPSQSAAPAQNPAPVPPASATSSNPRTTPASATPPVSEPVSATATSPAPTTTQNPAPEPPPKSARSTPPANRTVVITQPPATTGPSAKELSLFRSLRSTALQTRRRAADAGATAEQLDAGDQHDRAASDLVAHGKVTEAADRLDQASAAWTNAERLARIASAAATTKAAAPEQVKTQPAAPAVTPAPIPQPPPPNLAATQQAVANPTADINAVVAAYARAIESRDLAAMRRIYPGMPAAQARGFESFFASASVRSLKVAFTVSGLEVNGSSAEAKLSGMYDYVNEQGRPQQQPLAFQASFRREGGVWQIASVR